MSFEGCHCSVFQTIRSRSSLKNRPISNRDRRIGTQCPAPTRGYKADCEKAETRRDENQMKVVPLVWQMRAAVSGDGRIAKFFLTFKGGQHSAFAVPFHKTGL